MATKPELYTQQLYHKLLERGDLNLAQVWFDAAVLDKYRGSSLFSVVRTDTIGRLSRERTGCTGCNVVGAGLVRHCLS